MATSVFIDQVFAEVERARAKWPGNRVQLAAFTEEVGEAAKALLHHDYEPSPAGLCANRAEVWKELVQAAAMAVRVATEGDSSFSYDAALAAREAEQ